MKILIKGAGDLATGIASRLYGAGHQILMTEIAQPLTVRRTVALSRAVYDRRAIVEEMEAVSAKTQEDAEAIMEEGKIPVIVDPKADCRKWYKPDVIVDAIIAKKNTGTKITDAPFVIGIGPGFTAGKDCHCVIETKRGHTLGSVIWEGSAIADTGVPGNIGGYTTERLIRASEDGIIEPKVRIGDIVEKGQIVAVTGGKPVFAQMGGIVRGMLQPGAYVKKNLKIGDIDARAERSHCETISDKARAIGGGALEAAERFEKIKGHYAVVILAAGKGTRFSGERGESKLHAKIDQKPMYMHMMDKMQAFSSVELFIVTGDEKIIEEAEKRGIFVVRNKEPEKGIAHSVVLGLKAVSHSFKSGTDRKSGAPDGILFSVCDQPKLKISTIQRILNDAALHKKNVICAGYRGQKGNPVLWPAHCFAELLELTGDEGGRQMLTKYEEKVRIIETSREELKDIDSKRDLENLGKETEENKKTVSESKEETSTVSESKAPEIIHTYEVIAGDLSWEDAKNACEERGGYLATITSEEEYEKISEMADRSGLTYLWLGAKLQSDTEEWKQAGWITGEDWTFDNWYPGEPSRQDTDGTKELFLCMWKAKYNEEEIGWTFNDQRNDIVGAFPKIAGKVGYVCEYERETNG